MRLITYMFLLYAWADQRVRQFYNYHNVSSSDTLVSIKYNKTFKALPLRVFV